MTAYYNENDPFAAAWLRELIKENLIADGEVDERSIEEVKPDDLRGFTQCHFFAGIGVWSYALRNAGWSDDSPVWTGSCPCQSFSASGKRGGFSDKRHLWPTWFRLIRECRPDTIFGEQVSSPDGLAWLDIVSADLENEKYTIGTLDISAASVGAPHIRQRLYFVADSGNEGLQGHGRLEREHGSQGWETEKRLDPASSPNDKLVHAEDVGQQDRFKVYGEHDGPESIDGCRPGELADTGWQQDDQQGDRGSAEQGSDGQNNRILGGSGEELRGSLADTEFGRIGGRDQSESRTDGAEMAQQGDGPYLADESSDRREDAGRPTSGFWANAEWIYCRDEKWRAVEPGTSPLASGSPARVGRLRGYGNALCAPQAQAFIEAYMSGADEPEREWRRRSDRLHNC